MDITSRINFIRTLKGLTQKELGMAVGFDEKTADIRIAQYESGSRKPKDRLLRNMACVLDVNPKALTVPKIESLDDTIHIFFALEDVCGIEPKAICALSDLVLEHMINSGNSDGPISDFLFEWNDVATKFVHGVITKNEYDLWRYSYSVS